MLYSIFMIEKQKLRKSIIEKRKTLNIEEISNILVEKIRKNQTYIDSNKVMIFYPTKYEVNLLKLLNDNKAFYLPKVFQKELLVCEFDKDTKLEKTSFNIYEPCSKSIDKNNLDLVIVPALCVDKKGYRLGYGGGFYDRFLQDFEGKTIVAIPKEFLFDSIPKENFDIKIDEIVVA